MKRDASRIIIMGLWLSSKKDREETCCLIFKSPPKRQNSSSSQLENLYFYEFVNKCKSMQISSRKKDSNARSSSMRPEIKKNSDHNFRNQMLTNFSLDFTTMIIFIIIGIFVYFVKDVLILI